MATLHELVGHLPAGEMLVVAGHPALSVPAGTLADVLGITPTHAGPGACRAEMPIVACHLNQRGITHGGAVVALADAAAGWAAYAALPDGRFATVDLRCSFLKAAPASSTLVALVRPVHLGRRMLVLEADVVGVDDEGVAGGPLVARLGFTQLVLSDVAPAVAQASGARR
jgi:1,4-dihydroxy-2-naphthoyl-CoA hydrolase